MLKNNKIDKIIVIIVVALFLVPVFVREMFLSSFYQINFLAFIGCLISLYYNISGSKIRVSKPYLVTLWIIMFVILIISEMHAGRTIKGFVRVFGGLLVPLILLYYKPRNLDKTLRFIIKGFNIACFIIVIIGIVDMRLDKNIVSSYFLLADDFNYYSMSIKGNRLYSFLGHPLYNAQIFLSTFGLNYAYNDLILHNHKNDKWIIIILFIGIAMTASKSAIVIYLALLCILYIKNLKYIIFVFTSAIFSYRLGIFDLVISRFSGSLSTGRNELWGELQGYNIDFFNFFVGHGSDSKYSFAYIDEWARAAFEYPVRLFALEFGILFTIIIMITLFAIPIYELLKRKQKYFCLLIIFVAVSLHVNIYNGIGTYMDQMYMFCLFGCGILSLDNLARNK